MAHHMARHISRLTSYRGTPQVGEDLVKLVAETQQGGTGYEQSFTCKHFLKIQIMVTNACKVKINENSEIWIDQTFLNVSVKLGTNESTSNSITASIEKVNSEQQLIYTYLNTPRAELQNRSAIHYGTAMLCVDDSKKITGNYYTSRLTRGSMTFQAVE